MAGQNICIAVILQSLLYNSYIIVVKSVWYSCVSSVCCNYMCNFVWGCYKMQYCMVTIVLDDFAHFLLS